MKSTPTLCTITLRHAYMVTLAGLTWRILVDYKHKVDWGSSNLSMIEGEKCLIMVMYLHEKFDGATSQKMLLYHLLIPSLYTYHTTKEYEFYRPYIRLINKA